MMRRDRRSFLAEVGQGMFVASVGWSAAHELALADDATRQAANSDAADAHLSFGRLDPLVDLMQSTPADKVLPKLVGKLNSGTSLRDLVAAAACANARAFGGEDYVGFHTLMALAPSLSMAERLPSERRALPVLKVLYRNTNRLQEKGGPKAETLRPIEPASLSADQSAAQAVRQAVHRQNRAGAEAALAAAAGDGSQAAFEALMRTVEESADVHRVVLAQRAWDMIDLVGKPHALTMLRQSLRYCLNAEPHRAKQGDELPKLLARLLDEHKLSGSKLGSRPMDAAWIDQMSQTLFTSSAEQAADAVAAALADGISPVAIGQAVSLAANQLVLRDKGRTGRQVQPGKPEGSVHGDSIGVHASDSAHAWRMIAQVDSPRTQAAAVILAGWQVAHDRVARGGEFNEWAPRPYQEDIERIETSDAGELLKQLDGAIREQNQARACALVHRYGEAGHGADAVQDVLLQFATSEDGALHAEKYFLTTTSNFAQLPKAFRWREMVALARVTASECGIKAPGYEQACGLLKVRG